MIELISHQPLHDYDAVISFSPYHSINRVMAKVKQRFPDTRWIAQFSDPWAKNPLATKWQERYSAAKNERRTVRLANYVIHNSERALALMKRNKSLNDGVGSTTINHPFDEGLYPQRAKAFYDRIILRYVGTLFGKRSPENLFQALVRLESKIPDLQKRIRVELVGPIEDVFLASEAARSVIGRIIDVVPPVDYVTSLELMYDADVNLLIEADVVSNLFMPSKLSDYIGAARPLIGLVPDGPIRTVIEDIGGWVANPGDVEQIENVLLRVITYIEKEPDPAVWLNAEVRRKFCSSQIAREYELAIAELRNQ
jgi:glycosyltransferase involved in cell wall biosynthesis